MIYSWANNVNKKILRSGTSWSNIIGFKEDETRSGKTKRRLYASQTKREFSVKMHFTLAEYKIFLDWYNNTLRYGLFSFYFPRVDSNDSNEQYVYRFTSDGSPSFSNPSGQIIECSMKWEEV